MPVPLRFRPDPYRMAEAKPLFDAVPAGPAQLVLHPTLDSDPSLTLRSVRISPAGAVVRAHAAADGTVSIAAASARPLRRARLVALFAGAGAVTVAGAQVDEVPVRPRPR